VRASHILQSLWQKCAGKIDARRLRTLGLAIDAVVHAAHLTLTALGRALETATTPKHAIKRIDRLVSNPRLLHELPLLRTAVAHRLIRRIRHPIILVDWTLIRGSHWALAATLPYLGRSLPLYEEVHSKSRVGNRRLQTRFLECLAAMMPEGARPIIVADAGFRSPFFHACRQCKFDFVIRLRGQGTLYRYRDTSMSLLEAFALACGVALCLGQWEVFRNGKYRDSYRVVVGPKPPATENQDYQRRRAAEPWLLATTLADRRPAQIVAIYAMRMQIEETFRDAKNPRFGLALSYTRSNCSRRLTVLLAIAAFALVAAMLVGVAAEQLGLHRQLQANSMRSRRVLSVAMVGAWLLARPSPALQLRAVIRCIQELDRIVHSVQHRRMLQLKLPYPRKFFARR